MTDLTKEQVTFTAGQPTIYLQQLNLTAAEGTFICEQIIFTYQDDIPNNLRRNKIIIRDTV